MTFAELKTATAQMVLPGGRPPQFWRHWHHYLEEALNDLQTWDKCLQRSIVDVVPSCNTIYKCGTTAFEKPDGEVLMVGTVSERIVEMVPSTPFESGALLSELEQQMWKYGRIGSIPFHLIFPVGKEFQIGVEITFYHRNPQVWSGTEWPEMRYTASIYYEDSDSTQNTFYVQPLKRVMRKIDITASCAVNQTSQVLHVLNPKANTGVFMALTSVTGPTATDKTEYGYTVKIYGPPYSNGAELKTKQVEWCGFIEYQYVPPQRFSKWYEYVAQSQLSPVMCVGEWFGLAAESAAKAHESLSAIENPEEQVVQEQVLPLGWFNPSAVKDSARGRSLAGVYTIMDNLVVLAPWMQSYENAIVHWRGRKYRWYNDDYIPNWSLLVRACAMYAGAKFYTLNRRELATAQTFIREYADARARLMRDCVQMGLGNDELSIERQLSSVYSEDRSSLLRRDGVKVIVTHGGVDEEITTDQGVSEPDIPVVSKQDKKPTQPPTDPSQETTQKPAPPPAIEEPVAVDGDSKGGTDDIVEIDDGGRDTPAGDGGEEPSTNITRFGNDKITYQACCHDIGCSSPSRFLPACVTVEVAAGTFTARTKSDANAMASNYAKGNAIYRLSNICVCDEPTSVPVSYVFKCPMRPFAEKPSPLPQGWKPPYYSGKELPAGAVQAASRGQANRSAMFMAALSAMHDAKCVYKNYAVYAEIYNADSPGDKETILVEAGKYSGTLDTTRFQDPFDLVPIWSAAERLQASLQYMAVRDIVPMIRQKQAERGWPNEKLVGTIKFNDDWIVFQGGKLEIPCKDSTMPTGRNQWQVINDQGWWFSDVHVTSLLTDDQGGLYVPQGKPDEVPPATIALIFDPTQDQNHIQTPEEAVEMYEATRDVLCLIAPKCWPGIVSMFGEMVGILRYNSQFAVRNAYDRAGYKEGEVGWCNDPGTDTYSALYMPHDHFSQSWGDVLLPEVRIQDRYALAAEIYLNRKRGGDYWLCGDLINRLPEILRQRYNEYVSSQRP